MVEAMLKTVVVDKSVPISYRALIPFFTVGVAFIFVIIIITL